MRLSIRTVLVVVIVLYISCALWVICVMLMERLSFEKFNSHGKISSSTNNFESDSIKKVNKPFKFHGTINIWGKAAIGEYLWLHIFEGKLSKVPGYLLYEGDLNIKNIKVSYATGPNLIPQTANKSICNLILVVNGREPKKIKAAKSWLDTLVDKQVFYNLQNLGLVMLGNESCENDWLFRYIDKFSLLIKFLFIVYDEKRAVGKVIYQWPLGVATYRKFPLITKNDVDIYSKRKYLCNFLGTVYANSSRELLVKLLDMNDFNCYVKVRYWWVNKESEESILLYHDTLKNSDLTLCPVGINSESYRIYEAMSYGSIPVLEDVITPGNCGASSNSGPYALLKQYKAPVIYIKNWHELPELLAKEKLLSDREVMERRNKILEWYEFFRYKMRETLLSSILSYFE